ncbi:hypothetical protein [Hoeflea sp. TYP-13]|uniref:hypothetical protein n=1 Tax=Hoeflea sp. TYP-13 TaxID=3230023 RepID=UPI0034C5D288
MDMYGIAVHTIRVKGNIGVVVGKAATRRTLDRLLTAYAAEIVAGKKGGGNAFQAIRFDLTDCRASVNAVARNCRSLGRFDNHLDNAGMIEPPGTTGRTGPVAWGSDVRHKSVQTGNRATLAALRRQSAAAFHIAGLGVAVCKIQGADGCGREHAIPADGINRKTLAGGLTLVDGASGNALAA